MTLLLDTHTLIWWLTDDAKLGSRALRDIANPANPVYVSDIAVFESAIKMRTGRLEVRIDFNTIEKKLVEDNIQKLNFDGRVAGQFVRLPYLLWADPFDMAQMSLAVANHMTLVTADHHILSCNIADLRTIDAKK